MSLYREHRLEPMNSKSCLSIVYNITTNPRKVAPLRFLLPRNTACILYFFFLSPNSANEAETIAIHEHSQPQNPSF